MPKPMPDKARLIFKETGVNAPAGNKTEEAYDLFLYHELGKSTKGVLVVKTVLQLGFEDGTDAAGNALTWSGAEKSLFAAGCKVACNSVWDDRYRIYTDSTTPAVDDVAVLFEIETLVDDWTWSDNYEVTVTKVDKHTDSSVDPDDGTAVLDSRDLEGRNKGASHRQRGVVHEFGHMLALRDEYPEDKHNPNPHWKSDVDSVMNKGEKVRPRHYAMFASWLTVKFATSAAFVNEPTPRFLVEGWYDHTNAKL